MKDRVILHSDINNCFASIECLHRPAIRNKPVAICGDPESRRGIVLDKNKTLPKKLKLLLRQGLL